MLKNYKQDQQDVFTVIGTLQTVLERYPALLSKDFWVDSKNCVDFLVTLLRQFGITEETIMSFFAQILGSEDTDGLDGFLPYLEEAVKAIIMASLTKTYTCSVNPTLPDEVMYSPYWRDYTDYEGVSGVTEHGGIEVAIDDIDMFGLLNYSPVSKDGSIFYFDSNPVSGYNANTVYSSTDMHAFLWFCINKGMFDLGGEKGREERKKMTWDNRGFYHKRWKKNGCLNGFIEGDKKAFFEEDCEDSQTRFMLIENGGTKPRAQIKKEIFICKFKECMDFSASASTVNPKVNTNKLEIFLSYDRYYRKGLGGMNKTIFEFNTDYLASLKIFDTKTLIAQIMNAVLGIGASIADSFSINKSVTAKKIENFVQQVIEEDDTQTTTINDCYYTFTNDEYDELMNDATANYNGIYYNGNEELEIPTEEIIDEISSIDTCSTLQERTTKITNIFKNISTAITENNDVDDDDKNIINVSITNRFITETATQAVMQVLSPKVMLLFFINEKIMNPNGEEGVVNTDEILKKFINLIKDIIIKVKDTIVSRLYTFCMDQIRPLITLFIQKLLLETMSYYVLLIDDLIKTCTIPMTWNNKSERLEVENVIGADILVPEQTEPNEEGGC